MDMEELLNVKTLFTTIGSSASPIRFAYVDHEDSWMDAYFNNEVFEQKFINEPHAQRILISQIMGSVLPADNEEKIDKIDEERPKNKSAFHNFQKHLLTLLKKIIFIKKSQIIQLPYGNRAYELWRIFHNLKTSSKKNLYIIFGIEEQQNYCNLRKTAQSIPELHRMLIKHDLRQIEQGQELLRRIVCDQASKIQKGKLECECKMKKFEQFYAYFIGFMEQLSEGVISRRMTKQRKLRLIKIQQTKQ